MSNHVLETRALAKRFGRRDVLRGVDLSLPEGGVTVLLGQNGAGKTTLFKVALGLLRPEGGTIEVLGLDPARDRRQIREQVGFVPSTPDAPGWMTVTYLFRYLRPQYPQLNDTAGASLLEEFGVPPRTPFSQLSRGAGYQFP